MKTKILSHIDKKIEEWYNVITSEHDYIFVYTLEQLRQEIEAMEEWIPVTERLPDFTWEIFTYGNHNISKWFFVSSWPESPHFFEDNITHWMPLPPSP